MIIGLDLAPGLCGWAAGDGLTDPVTDFWELPHTDDDLGLMLDALDRHVSGLIDRYNPTIIAYEAPIITPFDKLWTVRRIYNLGGHVEFMCRPDRATPKGIVCKEVDLRVVKKELTGTSGADKNAMVAAARRLGIKLPQGRGERDAADAFGVWLVALREFDRKATAAWDRRIYSGPRGGLL